MYTDEVLTQEPTQTPIAVKPKIDLFASDLRPMEYWSAKAEEKLNAWRQGKAEGRSTGFTTLDEYFRLVDSELVTIAARPSMGKTLLAMQIAENMAGEIQRTGENGCVAFFSAEMSGWSLVHRMAGALANVNVHALRKGRGKPEEFTRMQTALSKIWALPIWIDDGSAPTTANMLDRLGRLNDDVPVKAMFFDFVELGGDRAATEELRISQIIISLKDIAKALQIPVVALSQVNRTVESRENKMPSLADLRYSGQIEQVSDVVAFISRPQYYHERGMKVAAPASDLQGIAYISIAKNRQGPVANVRMHFDGQRGRFGDLTRTELTQ